MNAKDIASDIAAKGNISPEMIVLISIIMKLYQLAQLCDKEPSEQQIRRQIRLASKVVLNRKDYNKYGQRIEDALMEIKSKYSLTDLKNVGLN